ncbi:D(1A) dopamine receptor isoform X1 [Hydra vulgaris]|uniref:D(1A) dopamine receptor isoform X1 n=1 Tax=Hydra vulgaris TaxID=6087 RepID=UPI001F5E4711|nr:D(1A) dopamine receptor [Hydra vulgaris]XP_047134849.1 D(1A) dopamine receptor [Hydra vulgaris]XP_047134850.1 D(1A) dopamine receptor [Hydra vulgaris]XP_047134851.1 D(1A) dopamine receptor [Hydra vulgaris]
MLNDTSCNTKTTELNLVIFYVLNFFIIVTVIGNALICIVIAMTPSFRKNTTYLLFFSLAVADMLVGAIIIPINTKRIYNNRLFCMSELACWISLILERTLSIASLTHLLVIGLERYLSLKFTFQYQKYATRNSTLISILCIWIYSFFWAFLGIFDWHSFEYKWTTVFSIHYLETKRKCNNGPKGNKAYFISSYILCFFIPIAVMIYTYSYVYRTAVRHLKAIEQHEIGGKRDKELKRKERQHKMVQSIVIVFIVYLICWLPNIITYFLHIFGKVTIGLHTFILVTEILPPFNSTTNPFIYVISNNQFRLRVCELLLGRNKERFEESLSKQRSFIDVSKVFSKFLKVSDSSNSNLLNMSPQKIVK